MIEAPETPHLLHEKEDATLATSKHWLDRAMPFAVIILSLASLYVALHTGRTMEGLVAQNERMVRAASTPILTFDSGNAGDEALENELNMSVRNVGTGPARISWMEMSIAGKKFHSVAGVVNYAAALPDVSAKLTTIPKANFPYTTGSTSPGILSANDEAMILKWPLPKDPYGRTIWNAVDELRGQISVKACYCSLFEECWESAMAGDIPVPVKSCTAKDHVNLGTIEPDSKPARK
jgi:hypothetical protein